MRSVAIRQRLLALSIQIGHIIIGIFRVISLTITITDEDKTPLFQIKILDAPCNQLVALRDTPFQSSVTIIEIIVSTPRSFAPPNNFMPLVEEAITKQIDI